jgi:hypothetical protein
MIDHVWTVVCSRAVIDDESKNVSIQNVVEQITVNGKPGDRTGVPISLNVVSLWVRSDPDVPARGFGRLTFIYPSGAEEDPIEIKVDLTQHERFRSRIKLQGLPAREAGRHYFSMRFREASDVKWREVASVPVRLAFVSDEEE